MLWHQSRGGLAAPGNFEKGSTALLLEKARGVPEKVCIIEEKIRRLCPAIHNGLGNQWPSLHEAYCGSLRRGEDGSRRYSRIPGSSAETLGIREYRRLPSSP